MVTSDHWRCLLYDMYIHIWILVSVHSRTCLSGSVYFDFFFIIFTGKTMQLPRSFLEATDALGPIKSASKLATLEARPLVFSDATTLTCNQKRHHWPLCRSVVLPHLPSGGGIVVQNWRILEPMVQKILQSVRL